MSIIKWLSARHAKRVKVHKRTAYMQRAGGDECCPWCGTWASETNGWAKVETHPADASVQVFTCARCDKTSNWIYGPGLFIHLDKEPTQ